MSGNVHLHNGHSPLERHDPLLNLALSYPHYVQGISYYKPTTHRIKSLNHIAPNLCSTLKDYTVVVIGAGGLGSHAVLCLADLGFNILIVDPDVVEISNCHRQNYELNDNQVSKAKCTFDQVGKHLPFVDVYTFDKNHHNDEPLSRTTSLSYIAALKCHVEDLDFGKFLPQLSPFIRVLDLCDNDNTRMYVEKTFLGYPVLQCRLGTTTSEVHYLKGFTSLTPEFVRPTPRDQTTPRHSCLAAVGHLLNILLLTFGNLQPGIYSQNLGALPHRTQDFIPLA